VQNNRFDFLNPALFKKILKKIYDDDKVELHEFLTKLTQQNYQGEISQSYNLCLASDFINLVTSGYTEFVSSRNYSKLPTFLFEFDTLLSLDLSTACSIDFPKDLKSLPNLTSLNLENCKIDNFDFLKSLHKLTFLNLANTSISSIPEVFCELQKLQILNLSNNPNITDDEGLRTYKKIQNCEDLKFISVRNNSLEVLPPALLHLKNLVAIDCRENSITQYFDLKKLEKLSGFYHDHMQDSQQLFEFLNLLKGSNLINSGLFLMHYNQLYKIPVVGDGDSYLRLDVNKFNQRLKEIESSNFTIDKPSNSPRDLVTELMKTGGRHLAL